MIVFDSDTTTSAIPLTQMRGPVEAALRRIGRQRWIRFGLRERLLRRLRNPELFGNRFFEAPFAGYVYPGNLSRWIDWIVYYQGAYELEELELVRRLMADRKEPVALDIGANVGHHTLYMASFCAEVHAFEPYDGVGRSIDEKIRRNAIGHVRHHRLGLSDADQELEYYAPQGANTGTGTFVASHEAGNNRPSGKLRLVRGDDYLEVLQLPHIDLIKIDVEGFEIPVVRGLRRTLAEHRPVVMLELSDAARAGFASLAEFMELFPPGFQAEVVKSHRPFMLLFNRPGCTLEPLRFDGHASPGGYVNLLLTAGAR